MAVQELSTEITGKPVFADKIVPAKSLLLLAKALGKSDEDVKMSFGKSCVTFQYGDVTFFSRLLDGRFPAWRSILPDKREESCAAVDSKELLSAVKRAMITADIRKPEVTVCFGDNIMEISGGSADDKTTWCASHLHKINTPLSAQTCPLFGQEITYKNAHVCNTCPQHRSVNTGGAQSTITIPASSAGQASFRIDPHRIMNFLAAFHSGNLSIYAPENEDKPVMFCPEDGYTFLAMPNVEVKRTVNEDDGKDNDDDVNDDVNAGSDAETCAVIDENPEVENPETVTGTEVDDTRVPDGENMKEPDPCPDEDAAEYVDEDAADTDMETRLLQLMSANEQLQAKAAHYKILLERAMRVIAKMKQRCCV